MILKKCKQIAWTACLLIGMQVFVQAFAKEQPIRELSWEELVPSDYVFDNPLDKLSDEEYAALTDDSEEVQILMSEIKSLMDFAPVVDELDGETVKISGYAVPLDYESERVQEFLLVPYYGACIHVPPPPGNQTVYVTSEQGVPLETLYEPISVTGKLATVHVSSELAEAGYSIAANDVEVYQY